MNELQQGGFWRIVSFPDQGCLFSTWDMGVTHSLFHCQSPWAYLVKSHKHVFGLVKVKQTTNCISKEETGGYPYFSSK